MAQLSSRGGRFPVGDYVVGKQIGSGSFSTVWHARHRVHGTEVAIKEIVTARLNSKLQDSLKSEIVILKKIDHPNIIRLHDMIEESGKIYIILEYCKGGDLSVYIQKHHGKIPEATAKHFMQQLASGLKVLRENNLIHRDLKPQNLLLFANDDKSILKIADFGFARSLQPRGLAETLCGSPLYMAPEIMQLQKYDAKADLWSVGTILYQLVIGKTPYTGSNQIQLLQNILKTELQFPPDIKDISPSCIDLCQKLLRRNPVERLTFEEFFNHPFLCKRLPDESLRNMTPLRVIDGFPLSQENHATNVDESSQEDCLPENSPNGTPLFIRKVPLRSTYGFSLPSKFDGKEFSNASSKTNITSDYRSASLKPEINELDCRVSKGNTKVIDSLELIDQDYVLVSSPPLDASSMMSASKLSNAQSKSGSPLKNHGSAKNTTTAPMPIFGTSASRVNQFEISEICGSAPGTSAGSMDMIDILEQQPRDSVTRIKNLQRCASTISELVNEKIESSKHLEAFSLQLVILSIWKQAFHICHSASDTDKSQTSHRLKEMIDKKVNHSNPKLLGASETRITQDLCSQIDTSFLLEVGHAEELSNLIEPDESYGQGMLVLEQCRSTQPDDNSKGVALLAMPTLLYESGKFVEAIEKLQSIQDLHSSNIGIKVAATEALVGVNLELDKIDSASIVAEKCHQIMETTTHEVDKDVLEALQVRSQALKGLVSLVKGDLESVESKFRGVQDHEVCSGNAALSYAEYLHSIRQFSIAKPLYQKLIQDIKEDKGFQDLHIAACNMSKEDVLLASICGLGQLEAHTGNFGDAEEILTTALKNAEECFGSHHPKVGVVLTCLALMFRLKTNMKQTSSFLLQEGLYRKAMELLTVPQLGTEEDNIYRHDVMALAKGGYAEILRLQQNRKDEGLRLKRSAETLWKNRRLSLTEALDIITTTSESTIQFPVIDARTCRVF